MTAPEILNSQSVSESPMESFNTADEKEQCYFYDQEIGSECIEMDTERFDDDHRESKLRHYKLLLQCIELERKLGKFFAVF